MFSIWWLPLTLAQIFHLLFSMAVGKMLQSQATQLTTYFRILDTFGTPGRIGAARGLDTEYHIGDKNGNVMTQHCCKYSAELVL
jgi:hypothetical protein